MTYCQLNPTNAGVKGDEMKIDDKFIQKIKDAIENETYDDLNMDEWEIIETLINICDHRHEK